MATARSVVNTALRKLGVLAAGREPRASDAQDTLDVLRGMYGAWIANGAFGRLRDVIPVGSTYTATGGERIVRESADLLTVVLPEAVSDAWVDDYGHERHGYYGTLVRVETVANEVVVTVTPGRPRACSVPPRDGAVVMITDRQGGQTEIFLYEGTIKQWQLIDRLGLDDEAPRSAADPTGLASLLAVEVADQFGAEVSAATARSATMYQIAMTQRFGMRREAVPGVYC